MSPSRRKSYRAMVCGPLMMVPMGMLILGNDNCHLSNPYLGSMSHVKVQRHSCHMSTSSVLLCSMSLLILGNDNCHLFNP